jgi:hypothetical protein
MGLDMYLSKKTYVKRWDFQAPEDKFYVTVRRGGKVFKPIKENRVSYVIEEVMYWRKANQIHNWFVENVQDGLDECQESYVELDQLKELRDTCLKVIKAVSLKDGVVVNGYRMKSVDGKLVKEPTLEQGKMIVEGEDVCEELLPASPGFFFGPTDYDQWYYENVKNTFNTLDELIAEEEENNSNGVYSDFYYRSSW